VPFLDHRLFEFVASLPTKSKLRGLREKDLLRRWASRHVPAEVLARPKQPYRAPDVPAFFDGGVADYVEDALGSDGVAQTGFFDATAVAGLVRRCREGRATGFRENQALVGILSAQLWHRQFVAQPRQLPRLHLEDADVALGDEVTVTS
jgi:asparagine synthase (glutamine-hydrolysing)